MSTKKKSVMEERSLLIRFVLLQTRNKVNDIAVVTIKAIASAVKADNYSPLVLVGNTNIFMSNYNPDFTQATQVCL
jgi:hypothetical protein